MRLTAGDTRTARAARVLLMWGRGVIGRDDACAWLRQIGAVGIWHTRTNSDGIERREHWRSPWAYARNGRLNHYPPHEEAPRLAQELWSNP